MSFDDYLDNEIMIEQIRRKQIDNRVDSTCYDIINRNKHIVDIPEKILSTFNHKQFEFIHNDDYIYFVNRIRTTLYSIKNITEEQLSINDIDKFKQNLEDKLETIKLKFSFKALNLNFNFNKNNESYKIKSDFINKETILDDETIKSLENLSPTKQKLLSINNQEIMEQYKEQLKVLHTNLSELYGLNNFCPFKIGKRLHEEIRDPSKSIEINEQLLKNLTVNLIEIDLKSKNLNPKAAELIYHITEEEKADIHIRAYLNKEQKIIEPISTSLYQKFIEFGIEENIEQYINYSLIQYSNFRDFDTYKNLVSDLNREQIIKVQQLVDKETKTNLDPFYLLSCECDSALNVNKSKSNKIKP